MREYIKVIGGGLAGAEAAYQLAKRGISVELYEMKPEKFSAAHENENLAEVVCSNSFKSNNITSACGLLKEELRKLDSLLIRCAESTSVPAGQALAVDRDEFSKLVTKEIEKLDNVEIIREEYTGKLEEEDGIVIIASGPLTSDTLADGIANLVGAQLYFFDAAAPIIEKSSINMDIAFIADRYGKR